jgi:hypothetical protein
MIQLQIPFCINECRFEIRVYFSIMDSDVEPHHFDVDQAPAQGQNFDTASAPAPTLLCIPRQLSENKQKLKQGLEKVFVLFKFVKKLDRKSKKRLLFATFLIIHSY